MKKGERLSLIEEAEKKEKKSYKGNQQSIIKTNNLGVEGRKESKEKWSQAGKVLFYHGNSVDV